MSTTIAIAITYPADIPSLLRDIRTNSHSSTFTSDYLICHPKLKIRFFAYPRGNAPNLLCLPHILFLEPLVSLSLSFLSGGNSLVMKDPKLLLYINSTSSVTWTHLAARRTHEQ